MRVELNLDVYQVSNLIKYAGYYIREKHRDSENTGSPEAQDAPRKIEYAQRLQRELERELYRYEDSNREIAELERAGDTERAAQLRRQLAAKQVEDFFDALQERHERLFAGLIK